MARAETAPTGGTDMSMLNAMLSRNTGLERMLDHRHFSDSVRNLDQFRGATPPGDDHVHVTGTGFERFHDTRPLDPAIQQGIGEFIQHYQKIVTARDGLRRFDPTFPSQFRRMLEVFALPAEPIAKSFQLDAQLLERAMLSKASDADFHELKEPGRLFAPVGADRESDCGRRLPLSIPCIDD